jgi:asparagine synthase (glutamine-hydrolysing)
MSYYMGIQKIGPAERLFANARNTHHERYWDFVPEYQIRYKSESEYVEHFVTLLREAVRCRLRNTRSICHFMSGGLDSTSIAVMAVDELQKSLSELAPEFHTVHWTVPMPEFNEAERAREVAKRWELSYHEVDITNFLPFYDHLRHIHPDEPYSSYVYSFFTGSVEELWFKAPESKVERPNVWMWGHGGDLVVGGALPFYYLRFVDRGDLKGLVSELSTHAQEFRIHPISLLFTYLAWPEVVKPTLLELWMKITKRPLAIPEWIPEGLLARTQTIKWVVEERCKVPAPISIHHSRWKGWSKNTRYNYLTLQRNIRIRTWIDRTAAKYGAEMWSPWDDTRLMSFVLAIPEEQITHAAFTKTILRNATQTLLPSSITQRYGFRSGTPFYATLGMRRLESQQMFKFLLSDSIAEKRGLLKAKQLEREISSFIDGNREWNTSIWMGLSLEMWLRSNIL